MGEGLRYGYSPFITFLNSLSFLYMFYVQGMQKKSKNSQRMNKNLTLGTMGESRPSNFSSIYNKKPNGNYGTQDSKLQSGVVYQYESDNS